MELVEDLSAFMTDFAVDCTVNGSSVRGIFDRTYSDVLGMVNNQPQLMCIASDVPSVAAGQTVVVNSTNYTIAEVHPDGTGMVLLILSAA